MRRLERPRSYRYDCCKVRKAGFDESLTWSCRLRTTEMSQAMDTGSSGASQAWPPWTVRGTGAGSSAAKAGSGRASGSSLDKLVPPATVPHASPPLHRSLLRNKYAGSADSTASDGGDVVLSMPSVEGIGGTMLSRSCMLLMCIYCKCCAMGLEITSMLHIVGSILGGLCLLIVRGCQQLGRDV